ncbi:MAG: ATP-binding protein, partial [Anaerolineae bacterium]|nr:ATP-binding protein [Anaerolineae bacterium]
NYTDGALLLLEERGFFLHTASAGMLGKRYWFGTKPTLNKLIVQYRQPLQREEFDLEIVQKIEQQVKALKPGIATWRVLVDPQTDLPEQKSLTLLIMPPSFVLPDNGDRQVIEKKIMTLSQKCGTRERQFRNTLIFLVPSPRGLNRLRQALRELAALEAVQRDYKSQLDAEQLEDLAERIKTARMNVDDTLSSAYTNVARVEGHKVVWLTLNDAKKDFGEHLNWVWKQLVEEEEWILRRVGSVTLQRVGLIPSEGGIRLADAIDAFLRYTDKPMIASREAVTQGLSQACKDRLIGIGRGLKVDSLQKRWCGEAIPLDPNEEGVWIIPPFTEEPVGALPSVSTDQPVGLGVPSGQAPSPTMPVFGQAVPATPKGKAIKKIIIRGAVPPESWADLFRSFVSPAARMRLKHLRLGIEFEMESLAEQPLSEDDPTIKAMKESAQQLALDLKIEE